ncbi:hypothetical protein [Streptomyces sp. NBC_01190]|uniref:hypothetical protein n=1 Tax=Streptomyces sp. NBC_01190 TaxID=2903767 RepID=UPI0038633227|nr:hypothetical protein OG519_12300 [Streptomyces sp. NBC_01190]
MSFAEPNVTEAYAFACLNCGHGWEQSYEIEHRTDSSGRPFVTYLADGAKVPSPLTRPTCQNCDGHLVRIMRAGQVSGSAARPRRTDHPTERLTDHLAEHLNEQPAPRRPHRSARNFLRRRQGPPGAAQAPTEQH